MIEPYHVTGSIDLPFSSNTIVYWSAIFIFSHENMTPVSEDQSNEWERKRSATLSVRSLLQSFSFVIIAIAWVFMKRTQTISPR